MEGPTHPTEQQLLEDRGSPSPASTSTRILGKARYEVEQGRKLIEKAISPRRPEPSQAELKD